MVSEDSVTRTASPGSVRAGRRPLVLVTVLAAVLLVAAVALTGAQAFLGWPPGGPPGTLPTTPQTPVEPPAALALGDRHTCLLTSEGATWCWGANDAGQLGTGGSSPSVWRPLQVTGADAADTALAGGPSGTCAISEGGRVRCWGYGGGPLSVQAPVEVPGVEDAVSVDVGANHRCAVTTTGQVWCWGDNEVGQLGDGTTTSRREPALVSGLPPHVVAVTTGNTHTCALGRNGGVLCWGSNANAELGDGTTTSSAAPREVVGLASGVTALSAGADHTCAVLETGRVRCWGAGTDGQLGTGSAWPQREPVDVVRLEGAQAVAAGSVHTCALLRDGAVACWGSNTSGQLGDGGLVGSAVPVRVTGVDGAVSLSAGGDHSCAATPDRGVVCWGANADGELGVGRRTPLEEPAPVLPLGRAVLHGTTDTRPVHLIYVRTSFDVTRGQEAGLTASRRTVARALRDGDASVLEGVRQGFAGATGGRWAPSKAEVTVASGAAGLRLACVAPGDADADRLQAAAERYARAGSINVVVAEALGCEQGEGRGIGGYAEREGRMPVVLWTNVETAQSLAHTVLHEVGHDRGLPHASTMTCQDPLRWQECEITDETGDATSLMSYVSFHDRFSVPEWHALGLLTDDEVVRIGADTSLPRRVALQDARATGEKLLVLEGAVSDGMPQPLDLSWVDGEIQARAMPGAQNGRPYASLLGWTRAPFAAQRLFENERLSVTFLGIDDDGAALLEIAPTSATG